MSLLKIKNLKNLQGFSGLIVAITTSGFFSSSVIAQIPTGNYETPNEVIERAFFKNDPNFYKNNSLKRQVDFLLGPGSLFRNSFPESEIARDAELVNKVYQDLLQQQAGSDPYIRTPDLPNPYNSSLLLSPKFRSSELQKGTEFRFEEIPSP